MKASYANLLVAGAMTVAPPFCATLEAAIVINGDTYETTSPTEEVTVGPWGPQTAHSTHLYSGYVLLTGSGYYNPFGYPGRSIDCFYYFTPTTHSYANGLWFGTTTATYSVVPYDRNIPPYEPTHVYTFIVDTGTFTPSSLYFGVGDSYYSDNTGSLDVQITQLAIVPEPSPALCAGVLCLLTLGARLARRRARPGLDRRRTPPFIS